MTSSTLKLLGLLMVAGSAFGTVAARAQSDVASSTASAAGIPRLPGGRPDFQGLWFRDSQGAGTGGFADPGPGAGDDVFFKKGVEIPYLPAAVREKNWRHANQYLDGEPRCHLAGVPRAAEQPPFPHAIIQDENYLTILYEYAREPRIIPLDNSPHPENYWAWSGDSRGHWEGDTLVIDVSNFNGRTWLDMTGNFVDENLHVVERYTMVDADTYHYEATLTDPTVFYESWKIAFDVRRRPDSDQLIPQSCYEGESDRQHYVEDFGGLKPVAVGAGANEVGAPETASSWPETIHGCLRGTLPDARELVYSLETGANAPVPLAADDSIAGDLPALIDREIRLNGDWQVDNRFLAGAVRALSEGCQWTGE